MLHNPAFQRTRKSAAPLKANVGRLRQFIDAGHKDIGKMLSDIPAVLVTAAATIAAALITAGVSFVNLVLGKEQKTSEFRQQWIDALREDLALFSANVQHLATMWHGQIRLDPEMLKSLEKRSKFLGGMSENVNAILEVYRRIQLRANPEEHRALLEHMQKIYDTLDEGKITDVDAMRLMLDQLIAQSQPLLKREWKRVKRGEPIYQFTKWVLLLLVVGIATAASMYFAGKISIVLHAQPSVARDAPQAARP